eukprot:253159-Chlamydomonas_euryale.AAC.2
MQDVLVSENKQGRVGAGMDVGGQNRCASEGGRVEARGSRKVPAEARGRQGSKAWMEGQKWGGAHGPLRCQPRSRASAPEGRHCRRHRGSEQTAVPSQAASRGRDSWAAALAATVEEPGSAPRRQPRTREPAAEIRHRRIRRACEQTQKRRRHSDLGRSRGVGGVVFMGRRLAASHGRTPTVVRAAATATVQRAGRRATLCRSGAAGGTRPTPAWSSTKTLSSAEMLAAVVVIASSIRQSVFELSKSCSSKIDLRGGGRCCEREGG